MIVFRLSRNRYAEDLSGKGAELFGGRWNSIGTPVIYSAASRALAMAEVAVHLHYQKIPADMMMVELYLPEDLMTLIPLNELSGNWKTFPYAMQTQLIGDAFIKENLQLSLKVPSAVVRGDFNYLINPRHEDIKRVKVVNISTFSFDSRIFPK